MSAEGELHREVGGDLRVSPRRENQEDLEVWAGRLKTALIFLTCGTQRLSFTNVKSLGLAGGLPVGRCIQKSTRPRSEAWEHPSYRPGGRPAGGCQGPEGDRRVSSRKGTVSNTTARASKMRARERVCFLHEIGSYSGP